MKKYILSIVIVALIYLGNKFGFQDLVARFLPTESSGQSTSVQEKASNTVDEQIKKAYELAESDLLVETSGVVKKILKDDQEGAAHQRFIVELSNGHTVLIAHNLDLASRVTKLDVGDAVSFKGEYEWNNQGGVVHWTHHDPAGKHPGGWVKHEGMTYQ